ncbi:MAG: hypothetical protein N4A72_10865 [Bacteroidales bacterium]|jgi:hypothetical protein|nr:hypothetical protein [Bacteroidales bacterium]
MKKIKTVDGQNVFDIAVQEYGNVEAAFEVLRLNPHIVSSDTDYNYELSKSIKPGVELSIDTDSDLYRPKIKRELENKNIISD